MFGVVGADGPVPVVRGVGSEEVHGDKVCIYLLVLRSSLTRSADLDSLVNINARSIAGDI